MKVAVITPTIGTDYLKDCLESVDKQTYGDLTHYIFFDGEEYDEKIVTQLTGFNRVKTIKLQENVGKGWYGHRVYAASSFLVNADIICYLDEDNWIEPNHVETLVSTIQKNDLEWAYSLRKIYDKEKKFLCEDNCESLGKWSAFFDDDVKHIDTSCYAVKRSVALSIGHAWYGQWGADRKFFFNLAKYYQKFECTSEHTLCYRLDGNSGSVTKDFFEQGNQQNYLKYDGKFPWKQKQHSLQVGPGISVVFSASD